MLAKKFISAAMAGFIFFAGTVEAYDLPKIRPDKKVAEPRPMFKGDWTRAEKFEQKIRDALAENENLPANSPLRVAEDSNLIFVAFYNDNAYFLDRYSIKIAKNNTERRSWSQRIFPIGKKISANDSKATAQKFSADKDGSHNSLGRGKKISGVENRDDRNFLAECFKVGYYYAFGEIWAGDSG